MKTGLVNKIRVYQFIYQTAKKFLTWHSQVDKFSLIFQKFTHNKYKGHKSFNWINFRFKYEDNSLVSRRNIFMSHSEIEERILKACSFHMSYTYHVICDIQNLRNKWNGFYFYFKLIKEVRLQPNWIKFSSWILKIITDMIKQNFLQEVSICDAHLHIFYYTL